MVVFDLKLTQLGAHVFKEWQIQELLVVDWERVKRLLVHIFENGEDLIHREDEILARRGRLRVVVHLKGRSNDRLDYNAPETMVEGVEPRLCEFGDVVPLFVRCRISDVDVEVF